jgi:hypothetical protein
MTNSTIDPEDRRGLLRVAVLQVLFALFLVVALPGQASPQTQTNKHVTTGEVKEGWNGDGTTKVFALSFAPTGPAALAVYLNGLYQSEPENYSLQGKAVIFTTAPSAGDSVRVKYVAEFNG